GVYAGVIAALAIAPVSIPLLYRLVLAENRAARAELYAQTARLGLELDAGRTPDPNGEALLLRAVSNDGRVLLAQGTLDISPALEDEVCGAPSGVLPVTIGKELLTSACFENRRLRVFAIYPTPTRSYAGIGLFAVALATIAGLTTALGVLRLLQPLSQIGRMLDRVGTGERGVRMRGTRIHEIDQLIERLNSVASAVEEREHSILGRVQVAQEIARLVAHEVRNPLQSMELLTSLLKDEQDPEERAALTASIHAEIRTLDDVVTRLLREGSTRGTLRLKLEDHDIDALITHVVRMKRSEAERKGVRIEVDGGHAGVVKMDRPLLSRSIENLVNNALRAAPASQGLVRITTGGDARGARVVVEDNGPGIDPELGDSVFEANVSGDGGSGLGLSLVRGVVEGHAGSVRFEHGDLGGARFVLDLPRGPA
ncbi:MAG: HAMP domain-containing histidine kinase, partial [Myxococcales bacterium]|nr:HAMP domain-containing histidine kinase [Myxococcales bacterium]